MAGSVENENVGGDRARAGHSPLAQNVFQALRTQISVGQLRPEQKLPSEHELAATYLVSRPIVREALRQLKDERLIYSRRGAGSFVVARPDLGADQPAVGFAPVETIADIQRCYEFRLTIEPDHAYWAALRWNGQALDEIAAALDLLRDATTAHLHREDADFAFHLAIAKATNNHYYVSSMTALKDHIYVGMKFHGNTIAKAQAGLENVFAEHRGIFEVIRARDSERARELMRRHLEGSRDRVFEGRLLDLSL
ncbi:Transcriptional regulator, GntR family [Bradyrhizobium sp. STM 3843]|uniref:FadR/GntR family transcriptional regulator n=1 Tax=Bradyrhizobium sp. STM 3843 TaxID=551947 RepID=UPI000240A4C2|nr:FadR/GntR family transcriptional regulator [Bradyrhizobium sp. STM 3843]CCE05976.1 Transcriptional regulator, GntR family [Bradyrhizobium sp. STM 3843]